MNVAAKYISGFVVFITLFVVLASSISADEYNLRNRVGESARCTIYSVLMQDSNYNLSLDCRDILYPGGETVFSYVLWAVPSDGGGHFKLGTIGFGKNSFKTKTPFSSVYVTKEANDKVRSPEGQIIMQGSLERNEFLDGPVPAPNPDELGTPEASPIVTPAPRNLGRIFAAGGVLAFVAIFGVILVIFVITRK
jgi:hypothetical protein